MSKEKGHGYDLETRLIEFSVRILNVVEALPNSRTGNHIAGQLVRCGTSPTSNYGEAQSAESRKDFIHKLRVSLKELRETRIWLIIIQRKGLIDHTDKLSPLVDECNELISIFVASVGTAIKNQPKSVSAGPAASEN
jgi:four helix bundle protein